MHKQTHVHVCCVRPRAIWRLLAQADARASLSVNYRMISDVIRFGKEAPRALEPAQHHKVGPIRNRDSQGSVVEQKASEHELWWGCLCRCPGHVCETSACMGPCLEHWRAAVQAAHTYMFYMCSTPCSSPTVLDMEL